MTINSQLRELAAFSARIGSDPLLTQGAGGNTSLKDGDTLYVKASGKKLAHAETDSVFVRVSIGPIALASREDRSPEVFIDEGGSGLRGSIETPFHALIPQRVVVHVHSIRAIAHAVRENGEEILRARLADLRWCWIPYAKPGWPLTRLIAASFSEAPEVWILQNHGVIVAADSVDEADRLLMKVEERLALPESAASDWKICSPDLEPLGAPEGWRLPVRQEVHQLAKDRLIYDRFRSGVLTPDQAVFLGAVIGTEMHSANPSIVVVAEFGKGVFLRSDAPAAADDLLGCVFDVLMRTDESAVLRYLNANEVAELLDWDAEKYRQNLNK